MISQVMNNSALCAKVQAMLGKALTEDDYDAVMNMKSVPDVARYLIENTAYSKVFKGVSVSSLHRRQLEEMLKNDLNSDTKRLMPYMNSGTKKFMGLMVIEDSIASLKVCMRLLNIGNTEEAVERLYKIEELKDLKREAVPDNISIDDFIGLLKRTPYYEALQVFIGKPDKQLPFYMEMALDTYWTKMVIRYAKKYLSAAETKSVLKVYGTEFDFENLTFLLRCKRTFDMSDEEIYASIIPQYYRLSESTVANIVKSSSYKEALNIIREETPYGKAFSADDRFIEKRYKEYMCSLTAHTYGLNRYSVQSPIYYIHTRRTEINNIISIIEGIRYGLPAEKIRGYLIGCGKGGASE